MVERASRESDRFEDDVVRGEPELGEPLRVELLEDGAHTLVVGIFRRRQGEEEARIDEDHLL